MDKGQILCDYRTAKNHKKRSIFWQNLMPAVKKRSLIFLQMVATHGHSIPTALIYP